MGCGGIWRTLRKSRRRLKYYRVKNCELFLSSLKALTIIFAALEMGPSLIVLSMIFVVVGERSFANLL